MLLFDVGRSGFLVRVMVGKGPQNGKSLECEICQVEELDVW
jgi:hypothetical protein